MKIVWFTGGAEDYVFDKDMPQRLCSDGVPGGRENHEHLAVGSDDRYDEHRITVVEQPIVRRKVPTVLRPLAKVSFG